MITLNVLRTRETDYEYAVDIADVIDAIGEAGIGMPAPGRHSDESDNDYFDRLADLAGFEHVLNILTERAIADPTGDDPEISDETTWTMTDWNEADTA